MISPPVMAAGKRAAGLRSLIVEPVSGDGLRSPLRGTPSALREVSFELAIGASCPRRVVEREDRRAAHDRRRRESGRPQLPKRNPRRPGGTLKDAERRRLGQARRERARPERHDGAILWCDGGARGDRAALAYVLADDGGVLAEEARRLENVTATTAEYRALVEGLRAARALGLRGVDVRLDAQLVVAHVRGELTVKNAALARLRDEAAALVAEVGAGVRWVSRDENGRANELVQGVLAE